MGGASKPTNSGSNPKKTPRPILEDFAYVVNSDVRGGALLHKAPPFGQDPRPYMILSCIGENAIYLDIVFLFTNYARHLAA